MWDLVGNPEDRFSHNEAQILSNTHLISSPDTVNQLNFAAIFFLRTAQPDYGTCMNFVQYVFMDIFATINFS